MAGYKVVFGLVFAMLVAVNFAYSNPLGVCVRNCAQCKRMFGSYFNGESCAKMCIKFKGSLIPDCADIGSIEPFLIKYEDNNIAY